MNPLLPLTFIFLISVFSTFARSAPPPLPEYEVLGIPISSALSMSRAFQAEDAHANDNPCSNFHNNGDISNMWCHMGISEVVYEELKRRNAGEFASHAGALLFFGIKELGDLKYDWDDINTAPITYHIDENTKISVAVTMKGRFIFNYSKKFQ